MGRFSMLEMRRLGVSDEDIEAAQMTQAAQRRTGARVQSLGVIVGLSRERPGSPSKAVDLTERALGKRGAYDQAALLLDQQALRESSPERALKARTAAQSAKELSASKQIEFDFFGGNVSIAFQYQDAVTERLFAEAATAAKAYHAQAVLWQITRNLGWQTYECMKTAADLCEIMRTDKGDMARALQLLEDVGAIRRIRRGRTKVITVTPEGAFRGDVKHHAKAVERYQAEVVPLHRRVIEGLDRVTPQDAPIRKVVRAIRSREGSDACSEADPKAV